MYDYNYINLYRKEQSMEKRFLISVLTKQEIEGEKEELDIKLSGIIDNIDRRENMKYVMSDIHGCFEKYKAMLNQIEERIAQMMK